MTTPVSFPRPTFSIPITPALPLTQLNDDEKQIIGRLQAKYNDCRSLMELNEAYYLGEQVMTNLGIAIPKELWGLRMIIGWPAQAVDPLEERCTVLGFRRRGQTTVDQDLMDLWDVNDLDAEQSPLHLDALSVGSGWYTVGAGDNRGDPAMIRVESPLNMIAEWDPRTLRPKNVLQQYWANQSWHAALYTPTETVLMDANEQNQWEVVDRQPHNLGRPLVVRIANKPRSRARDGASEITPAIRNLTDSACRALLNLQVAGEIYAVPRRYILGATESDFQNSDGTAKSGWDTYLTSVLALERDDQGEIPTVGQFQAYDPAAFTKVLDFYAAKMAGMIGATPQELGLYTEGNPPSADGAAFADSRRDRKARKKHALFGCGHAEAMKLGVMIQNGGALPADMEHIDVDWADPSFASFPAMANGISQLVATNVLPPNSDVTWAKAGFTPVQRAQLAKDAKSYEAQQTLRDIAANFKPQQPQVSSDSTGQQPPAAQ